VESEGSRMLLRKIDSGQSSEPTNRNLIKG
jgi:hypothetical protein